jgi:hypothetical protein
VTRFVHPAKAPLDTVRRVRAVRRPHLRFFGILLLLGAILIAAVLYFYRRDYYDEPTSGPTVGRVLLESLRYVGDSVPVRALPTRRGRPWDIVCVVWGYDTDRSRFPAEMSTALSFVNWHAVQEGGFTGVFLFRRGESISVRRLAHSYAGDGRSVLWLVGRPGTTCHRAASAHIELARVNMHISEIEGPDGMISGMRIHEDRVIRLVDRP